MPRRRLRPIEIREAESVFGAELPYGAIWIHERAHWPNWVGVIGALLTRRPQPAAGNAVTLGQSAYFPRSLRTGPAEFESRIFGDMAWLMHELTHVWQFRQHGDRYAFEAVRKTLRHGAAAYDYGGEKGLNAAAERHSSLSDFNPEQQGDIVRDYYLRRRLGLATGAWEPFVAELRGA